MPNRPPSENQTPPGLLPRVRVLDLTHYIGGLRSKEAGRGIAKGRRQGRVDRLRRKADAGVERAVAIVLYTLPAGSHWFESSTAHHLYFPSGRLFGAK